MLNSKERSNHSNRCAQYNNTTTAPITYKDIQFHSFPGSNRLIVSYKDLYTITFPIDTSFNGILVDDIAECFSIILCMLQCEDLIKKHHTSRRLCIYHNSIMIAPLIETLINHNSYSSYHLFTSSIEYESVSRMLLKRFNTIVYNSNEPNLTSMLRIIRNDQDIFYDIDNSNIGGVFDSLIILHRENSLNELIEILHWRKQNTYILLPYNYTTIWILRYIYRYYCNIEMLSNVHGYCMVKISKVNIGVNSMVILKKLYEWYDKFYHWIRPMCVKDCNN